MQEEGNILAASTSLAIQQDVGNSQADKTSKKALFHVGVFLESHILNNWRQLMMVSNHDPSLQPTATVLRILSKDITSETVKNL